MKPRNLFIISVLFWLSETWYFGWNTKPSCRAERICDWMAIVTYTVAVFQMAVQHIANEVVKKIKKELK